MLSVLSNGTNPLKAPDGLRGDENLDLVVLVVDQLLKPFLLGLLNGYPARDHALVALEGT
jgi:hypothetical protein